jgi:MoaA/NifB/PqqE/SkfB family radical SAM enzyme
MNLSPPNPSQTPLSRIEGPLSNRVEGFARPYVISWNLTYRCNLACEHCYLDAGPKPLVGTENFADRSELGTEECFRVIDDIAAFAPECLTILTGGEPLLRRDILEIVRRAAERGLWVVVGTNGVRITRNVAKRLAEAGARGLSLSLDALDPDCHDRFRMVRGAWQNTVEGAEILNRTGLPFIVQTTAGSHNLGELDAIADFAHDRLAAKVWNLYFLVPTGRGQFVSDMTPRSTTRCSPPSTGSNEVRPTDAREREVRPALHQNRSGECQRRDRTEDQDLLRRGRRVSSGNALHGDPAER